MGEEFLRDRMRSLEEEFFKKRDRELVERMRTKQARESAREALSRVSGLTDAALLDHLVELGLTPDTLTALELVPLVEVAWADGALDERERSAILRALAAAGVAKDTAPYALVQDWLATPPAPRLLEAWTAYTSGLCARLSPVEREELRESAIGRARAVATAAGGFLGLGSKISAAEEKMLARLEAAFQA